jgi:glycosyltransferase involved in cell wall biosynthesis
MKILQVINTLDTGGAEKLLLETIPLFNEKEILMDVLVFDKKLGVCLNKLQEMNCCTVHSLNSNSLYSPFNIFKIIPYFKKYDLIHVHLFPAQYWVVLAKIISFSKVKLVFTEHSSFNRRRQSFFFRGLDKFIYKYYDKIICISDGVKNELLRVIKLPLNNLITIENAIDLKKFENVILLDKKDIHKLIFEHDKLLVQVSKFRAEKDQITVIKSMLLLPDHIKLILVGEGPLRIECEMLVNVLSLEKRVFFLGNRNDVERILKTADLSILSSHWEGFGLVAVEGMAASKPVIASDVIGLSEVVAGAGLLFERGNEIQLANIIKNLLLSENFDFYNDISNKCKIRAQQYDINKMIIKSINLYNILLSN